MSHVCKLVMAVSFVVLFAGAAFGDPPTWEKRGNTWYKSEVVESDYDAEAIESTRTDLTRRSALLQKLIDAHLTADDLNNFHVICDYVRRGVSLSDAKAEIDAELGALPNTQVGP